MAEYMYVGALKRQARQSIALRCKVLILNMKIRQFSTYLSVHISNHRALTIGYEYFKYNHLEVFDDIKLIYKDKPNKAKEVNKKLKLILIGLK